MKLSLQGQNSNKTSKKIPTSKAKKTIHSFEMKKQKYKISALKEIKLFLFVLSPLIFLLALLFINHLEVLEQIKAFLSFK